MANNKNPYINNKLQHQKLNKDLTPHIRNISSGANYYDPNHSSIFEVYFEGLPLAVTGVYGSKDDFKLLSEQVTEVSGLDALQKTVSAGEQKFQGVTVSFLNPVMDTTAADITITFNLNLRYQTDNFVLNMMKAWAMAGYDMATGARVLKKDYILQNLRIAEANRNGIVWRSYCFHDVMLTGITGIDSLNYGSNDARTIQCSFRCDWWDDELGGTKENEAAGVSNTTATDTVSFPPYSSTWGSEKSYKS